MAIRDPAFAQWLVASLGSGLVAIDAGGALQALNAAAQRILGAPAGPPAAWLGRDFREVLAARPQLVALLEDALDGRERPSRAELVLDGRDGEGPRTIGFTLLTLRDPLGAVRGAAIQFRDLAPFERMDEQERLRDRLAAIGEMAAGLVHELRNPLAGMQMLAGLLRRRLPPDVEAQEIVEGLLAEIRAMAGVLSDTLEFVRPAALAPRELDPVELLEGCLDRACARVPFPGKIERAYAAARPACVADPDQLRTALTDILVNALEAMRDAEDAREPRLVVGVRDELRAAPEAAVRVSGRGLAAGAAPPERHEIVFVVADSGPGIPPELRDRIFHPFFSTKDGGSGVGLARAQKVIAAHGGAIEVESRAGEGATFRVRLPAGGGGA
jgi:signal transduction histidine kinase